MAFPNVSDIVATTIENRSRKIANNVLKNNALLARLRKKGKIKPVSGGSVIFQELSYAENANFGWYSGYDLLPIGASDVISAAQFPWKQAAVPVTVSGLEKLQNSSKEQMIDLLEARISVAEDTMVNNLAAAIYSDGTGYGGKQVAGLAAAVPVTPTTGTYGSIDRSVWSFWQPQLTTTSGVNPTGGATGNVQGYLNTHWAKMVRGKDRTDLVIMDTNWWGVYMSSLQALQRFVDVDTANLGFPSVKFMDADVVLDGGLGGFCPAWSCWFLNTDYIFYRPHKDRDIVPLDPEKRHGTNQDAEVSIIGWAGNMTMSNSFLQGFLKGY
jgi:hypothetical protein